jgi:thiol-disulfide isomerase/thioredoxin
MPALKVFACSGLLALSALTIGVLRAEDDAEAAPEVTLTIADYDAVMELVASHRGKVVVMDAWSTWCEPCVREFPGLVKLHQAHGPEKVACISLSFDYDGIGKPEEFEPDVLAFLEKQGATFDNILASEEADVMYAKLKLPSIPAVFIYDAEGNLAKRLDGEFSYAEDVVPIVEKLLAE